MLRSAWIEIDLDGLAHNLECIQKHLKKTHPNIRKIIPVIKGNAYGHGISQTAKFLEQCNVNCVAVATAAEAILVQKSTSHLDTLVLGDTPEEVLPQLIEYGIIQTMFSLKQAKKLSAAAVKMGKTQRVHLKINTGMNRLGFDASEEGISAALSTFQLPGIQIEGIFSHFATGGDPNHQEANKQIEKFSKMLNALSEAKIALPYVHISNSSGILEQPVLPGNGCRIASLLFGLYPNFNRNPDIGISPFMRIKARIVQIRMIDVGKGVSYGLTWRCKQKSRIGVLPLGHCDVPIRGIREGYVVVNGYRAPIVGTICMDQCMIDLTDIPAEEGDVVTLLGYGGDEAMNVYELAKRAGIAPFQVIAYLNLRLPRIYFRCGEICAAEDAQAY